MQISLVPKRQISTGNINYKIENNIEKSVIESHKINSNS
jgi:hypothetical protein